MNPVYEQCIEYFKLHPYELYRAWNYPELHRYGDLFSKLNTGRYTDDAEIGCPMQVKYGLYHCLIPELVASIRESNLPRLDASELETLPKDEFLALLPTFAAIQELADVLIPNRKQPEVRYGRV